jgi:hypothetical protein
MLKINTATQLPKCPENAIIVALINFDFWSFDLFRIYHLEFRICSTAAL